MTSQPFYVNESSNLGLVNSNYGTGQFGGGISFFDYNQDGWDDITISTEANQNIKIYENINGSYQAVNLSGVNVTCESKSVIWVDIDNDGDNDLFVTCYDDANQLLINDGNQNFTNVAPNSPFALPSHKTWGVSFADYNKDGYLDFLLCSRNISDSSEHNILIKNNADGTYADVTASAGISLTNHLSFTSAFFDYDNDGWQDIFIANDKSDIENQLYKNNQDGTFTEIAGLLNLDHTIDAMSTTIGDPNNDGFFDIYVTNTPQHGNLFLQNNAGSNFTDISQSTNTEVNSACWGSIFIDAENNGLLDIYVASEFTDNNTPPSYAFFKNFDNGNYASITNAMVNDNFRSFAVSQGDVNNDGYPDLMVLNFEPDNSSLWMNQNANLDNNWLTVNLQGTTSNKMGIGAKLKLKTPNKTQYNYTLCGEGYIAQNSGKEFFGIGDENYIDFLKITWPSGIVDSIPNVTPNQHITVEEGNGILSTQNFDLNNQLTITPNPADQLIYLKADQPIQEINIYDINGKKIKRKMFKNQSSTELNINDLKSGIYFIKAKINDHFISRKIVKRNYNFIKVTIFKFDFL